MSDNNRPLGQLDANYRWDPNSFGNQAFRGEYDGSNNLIYAGYAKPGTAESEPKWQIVEYTYSGTNRTEAKWPELNGSASSAYKFSWTDRGTYTFS